MIFNILLFFIIFTQEICPAPLLESEYIARITQHHSRVIQGHLRQMEIIRDAVNTATEIEGRLPIATVTPENQNFRSEEALTHHRENFQRQYIDLATSEQHGLIISKNLPSITETDLTFSNLCTTFIDLLDTHIGKNQKQSYKYQMAIRSLTLIQGDPTIEHHAISSTNSYGQYHYPNLPNTKQFFVLLWNLAIQSINLPVFIQQTITMDCNTLKKWYMWRAPFLRDPRFKSILSFDDIGQAFAADHENKNLFSNALISSIKTDILPAQGSGLQIYKLFQAYHQLKIERLMHLIEALLMTMRGHNKQILNPNMPNRPACAEGTYLNLMKAVAETLECYNFKIEQIDMCTSFVI